MIRWIGRLIFRWGQVARIFPPTPAERTYIVAAESRTYVVGLESRGFIVAFESREYTA